MTLLIADHLSKAFGGNVVVDDVSFQIEPGEIVGLIGPNGAGKSTCFNMLNGQIRPDRGRILFAGRDITGLPPFRRWRLGIGRGFQVAATFGSLTVRDNVRTALLSCNGLVWRFLRRASGMLGDEADARLSEVGLTHLAEKPASTLAYGDQKRLELALALSNTPRLLLMDEPTAGMTAPDRRSTMALLQRLARAQGSAVLLTDHDMDVVFQIADRILVLDKGQLIADGVPAKVRSDPLVRAAYLGNIEQHPV
ncbi:MAG TPA: ABC transporter ATP-binding protein [Rhodopila sp.]|nr:ABC transporter ATP-binding protein [Rhodopila sp.]